VEVASDYILGQLPDGQLLGGTVIVSASLPVNEGGRRGSVGTFDHVGYKVSVVRMGVVDYREHQRRTLALEFKGAAQDGRFAALRDYLRDEKVRVKLGDATYSAFLGADLTPDDLFTLDYLDVPDERLPTHYRNLIDARGALVFDRWYG
jgi:hypothetical protein